VLRSPRLESPESPDTPGAIHSIELHITWGQEDDQMGAIALIFALLSILLIIGIIGTVLAITHVVDQSDDRDHHLIRDWDSREH
jgi:hypothetical protein